jgi:5-methyltetrahydrofolate--homocysteine methyltransferase
MSDIPNRRSLGDLSTDDVLAIMKSDLYEGNADELTAEVRECLQRGMNAYDTMTTGLIAGMEIVGEDFSEGILFVPEVLMSARAMKAGMELLRPLLTDTGMPKVGKAVIGTVKGDIHDIGKNLVGMMWEGAGIEVINLGNNVDVDTFVAALDEHQADILGMSALLTTTMPYMKTVIDALTDRDLRERTIVLVGGAPLNDVFAQKIGADAYCSDASVVIETAKKLLALKRGEAA